MYDYYEEPTEVAIDQAEGEFEWQCHQTLKEMLDEYDKYFIRPDIDHLYAWIEKHQPNDARHACLFYSYEHLNEVY